MLQNIVKRNHNKGTTVHLKLTIHGEMKTCTCFVLTDHSNCTTMNKTRSRWLDCPIIMTYPVTIETTTFANGAEAENQTFRYLVSEHYAGKIL